MNPTHVFTLPSGVECEVKEFKGKHQKLLTQQESNVSNSMNQILADIIVRVGAVKDITIEFVEQMLSADRNWVMFQARQFSLEFPTTYKSPFKYKSIQSGLTCETEIDVPIEQVTVKPYKFQVTEYADIVRDIELDVKRVGKVKITLMDGVAEKRLALTKKKDMSSHLDIIARNPVRLDGKTWLRLNLDDLSLISIEDLRKQIYDLEGKVNSEFEEEHPEADFKMGSDKMIRFNILGDVNFFFPSAVY